jgi:uncharacterized protein YjbJ (UPF0337 family)
MSNQDQIQKNWDAIKGEIRARWKELTNEDLDVAKGDLHHLGETIRRKTGEASEIVEEFIRKVLTNSSAACSKADESIRGGAERVNASMQRTFAEMEDAVRHRPASSVVIGFAAGILTGLALLFLVRRK